MKNNLFRPLILLLLVTGLSAGAQITPQPSSTQTIVQDFGLSKITLIYSRPNVKGRKIFGDTEPYGKVWRTGANSATVIRFTDEVMMDGHKVPAGEYGLFTISGTDEWTVILSKNAKQWGAYTYKESEDFLRFKVKPARLKDNEETFTIQFTDVFPSSANLNLAWEHTGLTIHLTYDLDGKVMARIDSAMATPKKPYYDAVIYYWNNNKDMNKALEWANQLDKTPGMPPMVAKLWKARVLLKKGDKQQAIAIANEGIKDAEAAKSDEYIHLNKEVIAEANK